MKVLLKKDVEDLGYAGEIYTVAAGYGRNFLLPRGLAVQATDGVIKSTEAWREREAARRAELKAEYEALAARINEQTLEFTAKAGESGKLYGSVTTNDVADRLNETLGTEIDRRKITGDSIRQLGTHNVNVRLSREVTAVVKVIVAAEEEEIPAEVVADAAADVEAATMAEAADVVDDFVDADAE